VVLCDTNGGTMPHEIETIVGEVIKRIPGDHVGIHAHNDTEQAVANSLAAVRAGARQIQGTLNGLGERCGNANLCSLIPTLRLKREFSDAFEIGVSEDKMATLMKVSRTLDDMLNRAPNRHAPYVGESAFVTKTGIHASAVLKDPQTYEHVSPESVGNHRKVLVSDQAGRSNVIAELDRAGIAYAKDDPKLARLVEELKEREAAGYAYESANASFDLLARRTLGRVPEYFQVEQFDVNVEQRYNANGQRVTVAMAVVKVDVAGEKLISAAEGNGPINALDVALRKDLGKYQKYIESLKLIDYRVRILNGGTEAVTRVLIESEDEAGERWTTIGVSPNIIDASFDLLARRTLGRVPEYFRVEQFDVNVEQRYNANGQRITVAMAVVKVDVAGERLISAAEGNGPVNALDVALRKDLGKYQKYIERLKLIDYRVRILNGGTEAVTRVLIESEDEEGERWTTIGVSHNIIDASFQALMDSVIYKLVKSGAPV
jgi:2-isopropylmalate synthase